MLNHLLVWRKVSITKCKNGDNCSHREVENKEQLPGQKFNRINGSIATNTETTSSNDISTQTELNQNSNLSHRTNSNLTTNDIAKNSTTKNPEGDLMVGSLKLVSCILYCMINIWQHKECHK